MAKSKKTEEQPEMPKVDIEQPKFTYVPDIPAQIIEDNISATVETKHISSIIVVEDKECDEVLFLRRILRIQEEGGFGRHLNDLINDRIKELKNVK